MMRSWLGSIVLLLVALFVAWAVYDAVSGRIASADSARDEAVAIADRAIAQGTALDAWGRAQQDSAARWKTMADTIRVGVVRIVTRIDSIPVPAECEPYTAPRDTLAELLERENGALRTAERQASTAAETYRLRGDVAVAALDSMRMVIAGIRTPSRITLVAGPYIGIDDTMGISRGIALSVGVRIDVRDIVGWVF